MNVRLSLSLRGPVVKGLEQHEKVYAEHQPEYLPLRTLPGEQGNSAISRWALTDAQRIAIVKGANIMLELTHFGNPLQPVRMMITDQVGERFPSGSRNRLAHRTRWPRLHRTANTGHVCVTENLTETGLGWLCPFHIEMAKEIMRGEQRLISAEERIRTLERDNQTLEAERDQFKPTRARCATSRAISRQTHRRSSRYPTASGTTPAAMVIWASHINRTAPSSRAFCTASRSCRTWAAMAK